MLYTLMHRRACDCHEAPPGIDILPSSRCPACFGCSSALRRGTVPAHQRYHWKTQGTMCCKKPVLNVYNPRCQASLKRFNAYMLVMQAKHSSLLCCYLIAAFPAWAGKCDHTHQSDFCLTSHLTRLMLTSYHLTRLMLTSYYLTRLMLTCTSAFQGVPLSQLNLASSLANIIATYDLTARDRSYLVMPLFHVHGLMAGEWVHRLISAVRTYFGCLGLDQEHCIVR